jgi:type I restriction enzyme S subunit
MAGDPTLGEIPAHWEFTTLGEICKRGGGNVQTGPFGSQLHAADYVAVGVPSIMPVNIGDNRLIEQGIARITEADANRLGKHRVMAGDIIYSRRGDVERRALVRPAQEGWFCGTGCLKVRLGKGVVEPEFASHYLGHPSVRQWIVRHAVGATMPNLNTAIMEAIPFVIPPLAEQKAIAAVLGALDDKIELNRRMNATLESMARALFQSWFVDFDPVRAKLDGRQPVGMGVETAALFPNTFEDSSLGLIPRGWTVDTIRNRACTVQYGFTQSASVEPIGPHFLRITDLRGGTIDWDSVPYCEATEEEREKYRVMDGDIFIARTGASTGDNIYVVEPPAAVFASYLIRLQFTSRGVGRLVGEFTRTSDYANHVAGTIGGSAQPNASAQALAAASLVYPSEDIADAFYRIVRPLDLRRAANERESRTLATLRDTLLPKLLSGELSVAGAATSPVEAMG